MEKSKSISIFIAKLKLAYPNYFKKLSNEDLIQLISMYQEMLNGYNEQTLNEVAKIIIKNKKYMPTIAEILEICDNQKVMTRNGIIEKMNEDNYFKSPRELEKAYQWLEEGIIPEWFKKDMMKYYNLMIKEKRLMIDG